MWCSRLGQTLACVFGMGPRPADGQFWSVLADADPDPEPWHMDPVSVCDPNPAPSFELAQSRRCKTGRRHMTALLVFFRKAKGWR